MTRPRQWTNSVSICPCESRKNSTYYHAISMKINMVVYIQKSHVNITWTQTVQSICVRLELSDILFVRLNPLELDMFLHSWMKPKYQYHSQWKTTPQTPFFRQGLVLQVHDKPSNFSSQLRTSSHIHLEFVRLVIKASWSLANTLQLILDSLGCVYMDKFVYSLPRCPRWFPLHIRICRDSVHWKGMWICIYIYMYIYILYWYDMAH
jgi:hypothetical protein